MKFSAEISFAKMKFVWNISQKVDAAKSKARRETWSGWLWS